MVAKLDAPKFQWLLQGAVIAYRFVNKNKPGMFFLMANSIERHWE